MLGLQCFPSHPVLLDSEGLNPGLFHDTKPFYQLSYILRLKDIFSTSYQGIGILSFLAGRIVWLSLGKGTGTCGKNVSMVLGSYLTETDNFLPTSIPLFPLVLSPLNT